MWFISTDLGNPENKETTSLPGLSPEASGLSPDTREGIQSKNPAI